MLKYAYFHRTMEELTLTIPYVMKKYKEPSGEQSLKSTITFCIQTLYLDDALL